MSLWENLNKILVVVEFNTLDELKKYREAIKNCGLNVYESAILSIVESKKEKEMLGDISSVVFLNEREYGLLGNLKNAEAVKLFARKFDAIIVIGDFSKRIDKSLKKMNPKVRIGLNSKKYECDISLTSNAKEPDHLLNFVKRMTEKLN